MMITRRWPLLYLALITFLTFTLLSHWSYDDPFITFRYADNLRSGAGFVYNPGERVLSTTTPLYALLLAGLGQLWHDLPHLSNLISAISLALSGWFLFLLGERWQQSIAGGIAALLLPFFPLLLSTFGAETCFYVMLVLAAFVLYAAEQPAWAMVLAALATLTRSDGVLVAGVLGLDALLRQRKFPWRMALIYGALISPWYIFSWRYFGSPFPVTLAAKQHQARMSISQGFARGFLTVLKPYAMQPLYWLHALFFFVGTGYAFASARRWLLLLAWGGLYFLGYTVLGVSRYFWYYAPLVPVIIMLVGIGVAVLWQRLFSDWQHDWRAWALLAFLLALLLWPQGKSMYWLSTHNDQRARIYRSVGSWLAENTSPDATVGTLEVGIIGYYAQRTMIGFAGLLQPKVGLQMTQETTYQDTAIWAVEHYQPDYLVLSPAWFPDLMSRYVDNYCVARRSFEDDIYQGSLFVYACTW